MSDTPAISRRALPGLALGAVLVADAGAGARAGTVGGELVMVTRPGCVHCQRWEREVGVAYATSPEQRILPLRRVDVSAIGGVATATPVVFTPTFLITREGREVARITGYIDNAMFWGLLAKHARGLGGVS